VMLAKMGDEAGLLSIVETITKTVKEWILVLTGVAAIFDSNKTTYEEDEVASVMVSQTLGDLADGIEESIWVVVVHEVVLSRPGKRCQYDCELRFSTIVPSASILHTSEG
jgi:hypothetical protein